MPRVVTVNPVLNIWPGDSTIARDVAHHRQESAPTEPSSHHHNNNISKYRPGLRFTKILLIFKKQFLHICEVTLHIDYISINKSRPFSDGYFLGKCFVQYYSCSNQLVSA